jgi:hypothetical protein
MSIKKMPTAKPAAFDPSFTEIWKRLDKLEQAVFTGNGSPSLKERVATMERAIQTQTWLMRTVLGVVLSNLAALMFLLLRRGL